MRAGHGEHLDRQWAINGNLREGYISEKVLLSFFQRAHFSLKFDLKMQEKDITLLECDDIFSRTRKFSSTNVDEVLKKSVIQEGFERNTQLPEVRTKQRKRIGGGQLSRDTVNDLRVIKMRSVLDTKHFYKRTTMKGNDKARSQVQVGTVIDSPLDFYSGRLTKKQRKQTLVDELLADADFKKNIKKSYGKIVKERVSRCMNRRKAKKVDKMLNK